MDLSDHHGRYSGSWHAGKLAALGCSLATGAILMATLLQQSRFDIEIASAARQLF